jgi:hypothetical protein
MVDYEQTVVLQRAIVGIPPDPVKAAFWTNFSNIYSDYIRAPYPGARKFRDFMPAGDYGKADERMQWFDEELFPKARAWLDAHPDGIDVEILLAGGYEE